MGWEDPWLVFRIGWCLQKKNPARAAWYYKYANDLYKKQNQDKSELWDALFNWACCYIMVGRFKDAKYYDEELSKDYRITHYKVKTAPGAISMLSELLRKNRKFLFAYYNRAFCYYYIGEYKEARQDLIVFLENGGANTPYKNYALELLNICENELRIPLKQRYKLK